MEIADDHNLGTKYARDMEYVSKCVVLDTLRYSTNNSILTKSSSMISRYHTTKVDLGPFGNELFIFNVLKISLAFGIRQGLLLA